MRFRWIPLTIAVVASAAGLFAGLTWQLAVGLVTLAAMLSYFPWRVSLPKEAFEDAEFFQLQSKHLALAGFATQQTDFRGVTSPKPFLVCETYSHFLILTPRRFWLIKGDGTRTGPISELSGYRSQESIETRFLEEGAKVRKKRWKYATKSGERDHRFADNHLIYTVTEYRIDLRLGDEVVFADTFTQKSLAENVSDALADLIDPEDADNADGGLELDTSDAQEEEGNEPSSEIEEAENGSGAEGDEDAVPMTEDSDFEQAAAKPTIKATKKEPIAKLLAELDAITGTEAAKQKIRRLVSLAAVNAERRKRNHQVASQTFHMVFTGNPGTGKTTFARLVARIFRSLGYLSKGHLVECEQSDLIGRYVGETPHKTKAVIDRARGGVLFIDEAYTLAAGSESGREDYSYGQEAIDTLLKSMEDLRDDLIVIVAGYPAKMEAFVNSNPGLRSRFRETIVFEDFSEDQLFDIFAGLLARQDMRMTKRAAAIVKLYISEAVATSDEGFGNARAMRTLFERALEHHAVRVHADGKITDEELTVIDEADILPLLPSD